MKQLSVSETNDYFLISHPAIINCIEYCKVRNNKIDHQIIQEHVPENILLHFRQLI